MSKLRGKDFCNCPHALMLLEAIEEAVELLDQCWSEEVWELLKAALAEHKSASDAYNEAEFGWEPGRNFGSGKMIYGDEK